MFETGFSYWVLLSIGVMIGLFAVMEVLSVVVVDTELARRQFRTRAGLKRHEPVLRGVACHRSQHGSQSIHAIAWKRSGSPRPRPLEGRTGRRKEGLHRPVRVGVPY